MGNLTIKRQKKKKYRYRQRHGNSSGWEKSRSERVRQRGSGERDRGISRQSEAERKNQEEDEKDERQISLLKPLAPDCDQPRVPRSSLSQPWSWLVPVKWKTCLMTGFSTAGSTMPPIVRTPSLRQTQVSGAVLRRKLTIPPQTLETRRHTIYSCMGCCLNPMFTLRMFSFETRSESTALRSQQASVCVCQMHRGGFLVTHTHTHTLAGRTMDLIHDPTVEWTARCLPLGEKTPHSQAPALP